MKTELFPSGYQAPYTRVVPLRSEADICAGTNMPGSGYDDDDNTNNIGDF